jgi:hypothetical protein
VFDIDSLIRGEHDENELRKDFTPSERVEMGRAVKAERGERRGGDRKSGGAKSNANIFANDPPRKKRTDAQVAKAVGFGNETTYRQAQKVVADGVPALVEAMDAGEVSISTAAKVAALPKEEQAEILSPEAEEDEDGDEE